MEQPVPPTDSTADSAPHQAAVSSRENTQQGDSALSWQVMGHTLLNTAQRRHGDMRPETEVNLPPAVLSNQQSEYYFWTSRPRLLSSHPLATFPGLPKSPRGVLPPPSSSGRRWRTTPETFALSRSHRRAPDKPGARQAIGARSRPSSAPLCRGLSQWVRTRPAVKQLQPQVGAHLAAAPLCGPPP